MSDGQIAQVLTPDSFSEMVLMRAQTTRESLLETMASVCEEYDIEESKIRKMITPPLLSRLTAECADARLLKGELKSKKIL
ncbi:late promoter transcriptional regulator [Klebsiella phage vB_KpnM_KpS110]|uniref:Late promoter transcription factor n=5 Tax=Taipeivirus TaxID=2731621 RepID=A0A5Q2F158_9CAUD|nr:late promoter transcriptional regulator [Klebsiella phage Menlow]YP_009798804.1 late promoter transcriptional regulator [Klebsiella phage vB_KpnM_KpS110]YP_009822407.1 late promoter transcriptional regulator [Escherichia phage vB_EcoM_KWBSE43-6]YP_009883570.1 late promoter transcriptional regulator [Klebsiella phage Magnus]YP_009884630.1 late promoter transcriptional regulator [Klebsiella phage UPM 2146]UJD04840.1 late promoter transcription factor [Klebsiella phage PWKp5]UPW36111.1 late t